MRPTGTIVRGGAKTTDEKERARGESGGVEGPYVHAYPITPDDNVYTHTRAHTHTPTQAHTY